MLLVAQLLSEIVRLAVLRIQAPTYPTLALDEKDVQVQLAVELESVVTNATQAIARAFVDGLNATVVEGTLLVQEEDPRVVGMHALLSELLQDSLVASALDGAGLLNRVRVAVESTR